MPHNSLECLNSRGIGRHIKKEKNYYTTFIKWCELCNQSNETLNANSHILPVQIFSGSPKSYRRAEVNEQDRIKTLDLLSRTGLSFYIHSIYLINLCRQANKKAIDYFKTELYIGNKIGCKGIVIHCGKSVKIPRDVALETMFNNLQYLLKFADLSCPILLETPAGQGTELLVKYEDFLAFYKRFTDIERMKLKICIDTCHVFAAGHDPFTYIVDWYSEFPQSLVLIHFNDSKCEHSSCKDRHEYPGQGYIGLTKMNEIADWCNDKNIPMVYE